MSNTFGVQRYRSSVADEAAFLHVEDEGAETTRVEFLADTVPSGPTYGNAFCVIRY